jgi:hypothetical protein
MISKVVVAPSRRERAGSSSWLEEHGAFWVRYIISEFIIILKNLKLD